MMKVLTLKWQSKILYAALPLVMVYVLSAKMQPFIEAISTTVIAFKFALLKDYLELN